MKQYENVNRHPALVGPQKPSHHDLQSLVSFESELIKKRKRFILKVQTCIVNDKNEDLALMPTTS